MKMFTDWSIFFWSFLFILVFFRHPTAVFFHLSFKLSALFIYLFGSLFGQEFLGLFVVLVFLISIDFWVVKNITGRLLVGLRWWNYIDEEGNSHWVFENRSANNRPPADNSTPGDNMNDVEFILFNQNNGDDANNQKATSGADSKVFWISIFLFPILWFIFLLSSILSFNIHWVLFVGMALVLSTSNLYGYIRCQFGSNYNYSSMITNYIGPKMIFNVNILSLSLSLSLSPHHSTPFPTNTFLSVQKQFN